MNTAAHASRIDFANLPWTDGRPGVRFKIHRENNRQIRLVEFSTSEGAPHWCDIGHTGYVLAGGLEIDIGGTRQRFSAGDGLSIPAGEAYRHQGVSIVPGTLLFMIEESVAV